MTRPWTAAEDAAAAATLPGGRVPVVPGRSRNAVACRRHKAGMARAYTRNPVPVRTAVLRALRAAGRADTPALVAAVGAPRSQVFGVLADLEGMGVVRRAGVASKTGRGRPAAVWEMAR